MRQRLQQLLQVPADVDYVDGFQALARLMLELRRDGPSVERLLRRAHLEREVGNHLASLKAARQALELDPDNGEVHYETGLAYLFLALARADVLPVGPKATDLPDQGIAELLALAVEAFSTALGLNPNDEDARNDVAAIAELLTMGDDEDRLADALRAS